MILLEPAHKILHTTVKFKRRTISVTPFFVHFDAEFGWPFARIVSQLPTNQELTGVESFGHISEKPVLRPSGKLPHCPSSA